MKKNKITVRVSDDVFLFLKNTAIASGLSTTKVAEQIIDKAAKTDRKTVEDCLLEVSTNSAAAIQELARIILADNERYNQYQQAVFDRTKKGLQKFQNQINDW